MPEAPHPKHVPHPWRRAAAPREGDGGARASGRRTAAPYAELAVTSNFTFLTGASHPEEIVERAAELGHRAVAITDRNSLAGVVRAHVAAREVGIPLAIGCRLELEATAGAPGALSSGALSSGTSSSGTSSSDLSPSSTERGHRNARGGAVGPADLAPGAGRGAHGPAHSARDGGDGSGERLSVLVYPSDRAAYGRLCRLLTLGKRRAPKGECLLTLDDLLAHQQGLLAVVLPPRGGTRFEAMLRRLAAAFDDDRLSLGATALYGPDDRRSLAALAALSARTGLPLAALNDVHHHVPERRVLQDVLTCIRHGCTLEQAGLRLFPHGERHLKSPEQMARLFARHAGALHRAVAVAERASAFGLEQLRYRYPSEVCQPGRTPMETLVALTRQGAAERYPSGVPDAVRRRLEHEFALVDELDYAPYFLTVHDLVAFARSRGILCQGRGAAANSAVCYCLGVTAVDPDRIDLLFERFVSRERNEPPDIDIDFEHERREEVIQYIYDKYGRDRAALTAEVITYRARSAIRDVGKVFGFSLECVDRLAKDVDWWHPGAVRGDSLRALGLHPDEPTTRHALDAARQILGFPRHLSQHVGGFVITEDLLSELVPIENAAMPDRTVIEWDKDDIDALGILKVDVLGLGMLTCVRKCFDLLGPRCTGEVSGRDGYRRARSEGFALHTIPPEDPAVYDMICAADTVGVFQIESRAQMTMLPRLRPRCFYDLVIEVAIVRPGPIQGDMVHPYLRRRNGEEPIEYPTPAVRRVLAKTLGVPLFQEQAMALAMVAGGFTPGEADELRRAMAAWRRKGDRIEAFRARLVGGMLAHGCSPDFAARFFEQIKGFSEYGFPESHAASFALLVYVSAWLKRHHPAAFAAALMNSQPMGFYAPAQIVRDAREHDVPVRPIDVNASRWDCTLEPAGDQGAPGAPTACNAAGASPALRLGMRLVKGLRQADAEAVAAAVEAHGPFDTLAALHRASGVSATALRQLARADAMQSMGLDRQMALWHVRTLRDEPSPLFAPLAERSRREAVRARAEEEEVQAQGGSAGVRTGVAHGRSEIVPVHAEVVCAQGAAPPSGGGAHAGGDAAWTRSEADGARDGASAGPGGADRARDGAGPDGADGARDGAGQGGADRARDAAEPRPPLPRIPLVQKVLHDYASHHLSLKAHPVAFLRSRLDEIGASTARELADEETCPQGAKVCTAGMVLVRQRPGTAKGIIFMTLEDETGTSNLFVHPRVFERFRRAARHGVLVLAHGRVDRAGRVVHVIVNRIESLDGMLAGMAARSRDFR